MSKAAGIIANKAPVRTAMIPFSHQVLPGPSASAVAGIYFRWQHKNGGIPPTPITVSAKLFLAQWDLFHYGAYLICWCRVVAIGLSPVIGCSSCRVLFLELRVGGTVCYGKEV